MNLFGQIGSPFMGRPARLSNPRTDLLEDVTYQIVPGPSGIAMAQIGLNFYSPTISAPPVLNPDMNLTIILDRSGSMTETYADGHVANMVGAIFDHISPSGRPSPVNLVFYDDHVSHAGTLSNLMDLQVAIRNNAPRGRGTYITEALQSSIQHYQNNQGMYIIVVTDGEFADKLQVQNYIVSVLLPKIKPDEPYGFRLHFVGAGGEVDREFLEQLELAAAGQGAPLVTQHHHAHLSHSHITVLQEMDRSYVGISNNARFGSHAAIDLIDTAAKIAPPDSLVSTVMNVTTREVSHAAAAEIGFLPRRSVLGAEFRMHLTDPTALLGLWYQGVGQSIDIPINLSLPKSLLASPGVQSASAPKWGLHLPWLNAGSPEKAAAREQARIQQEAVRLLAEQNRQAELIRQSNDLRELARGGLPMQAIGRLKEIGDNDKSIFTSDLAPEEAGLLRREGFRPLGMVTGSAMYHVGQAYASATNDCEINVLSDAYDTATALAVGRMGQELALIGGHGVVGVRLNLTRHEWADKTVEVQVVGTAVEGRGPAPAKPWMSDLSGQEWYALRRAGYEPTGLIWGHCAWFILTTYNDEYAVRSWSNVELTHWSQALTHARNRAMETVHRQATRLGSTGVAGVRIDRRLDEVRLTGGQGDVYEREHHNLVVSIIGTSIRTMANAPQKIRATQTVLSLLDGRLAPAQIGAMDAKIE